VKILVLHGPNLNLLGRREPQVYGAQTLDEINAALHTLAAELGAAVECLQSNHEGALIDALHGAQGRVAGVLINPGGLTHSSVSLRDALLAVGLPFVEVHLSNVYAREPFRHTSLLRDVAAGVVLGFGADSYGMGLRGLISHLRRRAGDAGPAAG
jgi:3-dehydroquinate dehydratase-2